MIYSATGHRPNKLNFEYDMNGPVSRYIRAKFLKILRNDKPEKIVSGLALGVDTIWALAGLELNIPVIAAVPFRGQESRWPEKSRVLYQQILADPIVTVVEVCEPGYAGWKFIKRDHWMVDNSQKLVCIWNGDEHGGTWQTMKYAMSVGREMIRIDPRDIKEYRNGK